MVRPSSSYLLSPSIDVRREPKKFICGVRNGVVVVLEPDSDWKGNTKGAGDALILDVGAGYMGVFSLWKLTISGVYGMSSHTHDYSTVLLVFTVQLKGRERGILRALCVWIRFPHSGPTVPWAGVKRGPQNPVSWKDAPDLLHLSKASYSLTHYLPWLIQG